MTSTQADALVEMGNAGPSRRRARTTGTDAVVAAVKHAVPPRRRDAVLKRLLADARLVARGVLSPSAAAKQPPSTCRTRRSVSFSRDLLVAEG